jgi:hypothetical protein
MHRTRHGVKKGSGRLKERHGRDLSRTEPFTTNTREEEEGCKTAKVTRRKERRR